MAAYAVAHLHKMNVTRDIVTYLNTIDATLEPHDGRFLVHGKQGEVVEGSFSGYCIIIEFPDLEHAQAWYYSDDYQEIVSLRTNNSEGSVMLIEGVAESYKASNLLSRK